MSTARCAAVDHWNRARLVGDPGGNPAPASAPASGCTAAEFGFFFFFEDFLEDRDRFPSPKSELWSG